MANLYSPTSLGITAPTGGFQTGGWYSGRQYWDGTLSDPGVIHPGSNQTGAGTAVAPEVNAASAALQGVTPQQMNTYLQQQTQASANIAPQSTMAAPTSTGIAPTIGTGIGFTAPASYDPRSLYNTLLADSGVASLEEQYSANQKAFTEAKGKNNDNPFLSEASRVGREAKLQKLFDERNANLLSEIAMKKADVEMQLNLATQKYEIDSDASKTALSQFNTLLSSGALNNANGQDIANLTAYTGMSSSMIQSAVNANKAKNLNTSTISYDDGTNQGFAVINSDTGEIIKKQVVAASKPTAEQRNGTTLSAAAQKTAAQAAILSYEVDNNAQASLSPEEYVQLLMAKYPLAGIESSLVQEIRETTGQGYTKP
jgi:hypothetical protein